MFKNFSLILLLNSYICIAGTKKLCENVIVVVDGYSSGALLPAAFKKEGFSVVHLKGNPGTPGFGLLKSYRPQDFDRHLVHD